LNGNNVQKVITLIQANLQEGPQYFDENAFTDKTERFLISELIREKVLHHTEEEVPHSINVVVEDFSVTEHGKTHIQASIITERDSQKGILIGKKGTMLKRIGKEARLDIEQLLDERVFLELWVKVEKDWRNKQSSLTKYGFETD